MPGTAPIAELDSEGYATVTGPSNPRFTSLEPGTVNRLGWAVTIAAVLVRAAVTASGFFYWDDFIFQGRAARLPLDWDFLTRTHDGHLMPAAILVTWLTERAVPLGFWLPLLTMVVLQAALAILGWLLLRRFFGARPLVLVPLVLLATSCLTLPGAVWWSAALNALPFQLGMLAVTYAAWLLAHENREVRGRAWGAAGIIGALLFFEKGLLLGLWLAIAVWLFGDRVRPLSWLREQWRQRGGFWALLALLAAAYLWGYSQLSDRGPRWPASIDDLIESLRFGILHSVLPTMAGGPLNWRPVGSGAASSEPAGWLIALSAFLTMALILLGVLTSWRARRAWIGAACYLLAAIGIFAFARSGGLGGPLALLSLRYTADGLLPLALALGLSIMPTRGDPTSPRMLRLRSRLDTHPGVVKVGVTLGSAMWILACGTSILGFSAIWATNPAQAWLDNARRTMTAGAGEGAILNQAVPEYVLYGLASPYHRADWVLAPLPTRPEFADFTNNPRFLLSNGLLVAGRLEGVDSAPGPDDQCGWRLGPGLNKIELRSEVFEWEHRIELDYLSTQTATAMVALGNGAPTAVTFEKGLARMVVRAEGGGRTVSVSGLPADVAVCVSRVVVGGWVELPATQEPG